MVNVLFVCIGNSCRSQMAEGFARKYGGDILHAWSAGIAPAPIVQPQTIQAMNGKNIDIQNQFPKSLYELDWNSFEVIVNMSGGPLPAGATGEVLVWDVVDPMAQTEEVYVAVRDRIEGLVMKLILDLRRGAKNRPAVAAPAVAVKAPMAKAPSVDSAKTTGTPQRFGFGRVRRNRD